MTARSATTDVETLSIPGNTFKIIEDGEATAGRIGVVKCELDPGWAGPPPAHPPAARRDVLRARRCRSLRRR